MRPVLERRIRELGIEDRIFLLENAQSIHDGARSRIKRMVVWEDGDHCIYNHSHEKHCIVADWFKEQLN